MKTPAFLHNALMGFAALALIGVLAFLYDKTQAVDMREQNEVLSLLRELKDVDLRWDAEVLRARAERDAAATALVDTRVAVEGVLRRLANTARGVSSPALSANMLEISLAVRQKAQLIEEFKAENAAARLALDSVVRQSAELATQAAEQKTLIAGFDAGLARLANAAPLYYWQGRDTRDVDAALDDLRPAIGALPEALLPKGANIREAGQTLLKRKAAEQKLVAQIGTLSAGPLLNHLTLSLNRELEAKLQEKEVYRAYLIGYAAALLILLGWLAYKLKAANVSLEKRVVLRTAELSDALKHLKESETQLIQSEKMSSLGQMVAGVAHEINTPLAYVKNSLGTVAEKLPALGGALNQSEKLLTLLQAGADANPQELSSQFALVSQQLAKLKAQGVVEELTTLVNDGVYGTGQMAEIVGNLKDFSRLDRSKVAAFNLNDGLTSTQLLAKHLLKSVTVVKQFGAIPDIVCSPSQINQVFLNLITNAAQALDGVTGGTITLATRTEGGEVIADVLDNGRGIPPDVLPKIFDPFFSTKEIGKGTGLGLSISFKIIQQHGGRIEVQSQPGATRFSVRLPLKMADAGLPGAGAAKDLSSESASARTPHA